MSPPEAPLVAPAPCPRVAAAVGALAGREAAAVRAWEPLPEAPEGWAWRGAVLDRRTPGRRWTIGRRAAWDGLWQLLLWVDGSARVLRVGGTVGEIVAWVEAERARRVDTRGGGG